MVRNASVAALVPLVLWSQAAVARADPYPRNPQIDIEHYAFALTLRDDTDAIAGDATIRVRFTADGVSRFELDLVCADGRADGRGMAVEGVETDGRALQFTHAGDRLGIVLGTRSRAGERRDIRIRYRGTPAAGLIIGPNKHGDRTFFSDNWPDKARHWLPTLDHPYDKATSELIITAPAHYQVVSNGLLAEETDLAGGVRRSHWREAVPIASWLTTLGAARFAVQHAGTAAGVPVQTWVFPQDRDAGFHDFPGPTRAALEFFSRRIGPFPYEKLANVQSNSVEGAMESATAIFYDADAVTGRRDPRWQDTIVHEIAHHWWGNAVTERDWDDVWLSEGFATYFALLFEEHVQGREAVIARLRRGRELVRAFDTQRPDYRLVHDDLADMSQVLTPQIYQKGAWILHMLRGLVGDEAFWAAMRLYYERHRHANASTLEFRTTVEEVAQRDLAWFFTQWLERGGYPRVDAVWRYDRRGRTLEVDLRQVQPGEPFRLPLQMAVSVAGEPSPRLFDVELLTREQQFRFPLETDPLAVALDPGTWLLADTRILRARAR